MTRPAPDRRRRLAHLLSLLPWTGDDLESILVRAGRAEQDPPALGGRRVLFLWSEPGGSGPEGSAPAAEDTLLWAGALEAGARPELSHAAAAAWRTAILPDRVAAIVASPPEPSGLVPIAGRAHAPVVSAGTSQSDPVRALADLSALRQRGLSARQVRVAWCGPPGPRLHSWIELATRFPIELDLYLEPGPPPDPALLAFAEERSKGEFHARGRAAARERATVVFSRQGRGRVTGEALEVPVSGPPPWPRAWDAALGRAVLEELVERTERAGGEA